MGRRIVITDIHGCYNSFKILVEDKVKLTSKDSLYLLGDYINKGPYSREVLDYLMQLKKTYSQVYILRGNHEEELLAVIDGKRSIDGFISKGGQTFLRSFKISHPAELPVAYVQFVREMKYFIELPDFLLVHAGFDFSKQNPFTESEVLVNIRDYAVDLKKTSGRKVIHGHTPTDLQKIRKSLRKNKSLHYSLDAGCAYRTNPKQGRLIALDLDSWELFIQSNSDPSHNYA